jgi:hypothetical protein
MDQGDHAKEKKLFVLAEKFFADRNIRIGQLLFVDRYRLLAPMRFLQKFALERAGERHFAFGAAADGADIAMHGGTTPPGAPLAA